MRRAVRAIIIHDGKLLVMHRNKFGNEYETLPGGNIEVGETPEQALARELYDETSLEFQNPRAVFVEEAGDPYGTQLIYLCDYVSGEPKIRPGSDEDNINQLGQNLHEPRWIPLDELADKPFRSEKLKAAVLAGAKDGFPESPTEIR